MVWCSMRMDITKVTVTFCNFVKLPTNATVHTTILPPVASAEGKCVFLIPKFHSSKI